MSPPRLAERLLARALETDPASGAILGDLHEDFVRLRRRRGALVAGSWYTWQALALALGRVIRGGWRPLMRSVPRGRLSEDIVHAFRSVRRSPGFSAFVAGVIGLGVAAVTSVFSVVAPLTWGLPFDESHQLVWISHPAEGDSSLAAVTSRTVNLIDFREQSRSFQGIAGYDAFFAESPRNLTSGGETEKVTGVPVTHDFLDVLRIEPLLGRGFTREEGQPGGSDVAVLSHDFWRDRFAADPGVVGRTIVLSGRPYDIVGVLPADFDFSSVFAPGQAIDLLLPFVVSRDNAYQGNVLSMIGRLGPGVTPEAAQADLNLIVNALGRADPQRWGLGARVTPLREHLARPLQSSFLLLAAAAGVLLLIVCGNVSGLLLTRSTARKREIAIRGALGASRVRLVRQLMLEAMGLAALGAALGSLLAWVTVQLVKAGAAVHVPLMTTVHLEMRALLVAAGVALLTGTAVGPLPALRGTRGRVGRVLRSASPGAGRGRGSRRLRHGLVVTEIAFACALTVAGALLLTSLRAVLQVDLGFEPEDTVAWQLNPSRTFAAHEQRAQFYDRLGERVAALPGVERVGLVDALPLGRNRTWPFRRAEHAGRRQPTGEAFPHVVSPGYLPTMEIPLLAGRNFEPGDDGGSEPVVILNQTAAHEIFGDAQQAIGQTLNFWGPWTWRVVGVAGDVRHLTPETGAGNEVYFPLGQMPDVTTMDLVVRSSLPPADLAPVVSSAIRELDPGLPMREFWSLEEIVREAVATRRFALGVLAAFGAAALLLAGLGIYGVLSQTVVERRAEIGIRMALGASGRDIVRTVIRSMALLTVAGIAAGWILTLAFSGVLRSLLFGIGTTSPIVFAVAAGALLVVACLAAGVPVYRAVSTEAARVLTAD